jgi:hypothetical protein
MFDLQAMEDFCRQIGLPVHAESKQYTKLFLQEQPTKEPQAKEKKEQNKTSETENPFD